MINSLFTALALLLQMLAQSDSGAATAKQEAPCVYAKSDNNAGSFTCNGIDDKTATRLLQTLNQMLSGAPEPFPVSQRHLGNAQKQALVRKLKAYSGSSVSILCPSGDEEAGRYAEDYMEVLRSAGWVGLAGSRPDRAIFGPGVSGVVILINQEDESSHKIPPQATALLRALKQTGITARGSRDEKVAPGTVRIVVARNPLQSAGAGVLSNK